MHVTIVKLYNNNLLTVCPLDKDVFFMSLRRYDLIVFTASLEPYGARIADHLDGGRRLFKRHYYRHHCASLDYNGTNVLTKDLRQMFAGDLENVIIVDNSPWAYHHNNDNAIPIRSWYEHEASDRELLKLLPILDALRFVNDVRTVLGNSSPSKLTLTHMPSSSSVAGNDTTSAARGSKLLPLMSSGPTSRSASAYATTPATDSSPPSLAAIQLAVNRLRTTTGVIALAALETAKQKQLKKRCNELHLNSVFTCAPVVTTVGVDVPF